MSNQNQDKKTNAEYSLIFRRSVKGVVSEIYQRQKRSSKSRKSGDVEYSREWLHNFITQNKEFEKMYKKWCDSGYEKKLKPSIDRLNDYVGYTKDNIRLCTFEENYKKSHSDIRNGINRKPTKAIFGIGMKYGMPIYFYSAREAERQTGISNKNIARSLKSENRTAGGYKWEYEENVS